MSLLDGYEDEKIAAAMAAPVVPPRMQDPGFSVWGMVRGLGKSVPAGVAEMAGSAADIGGAIAGNMPAAMSGPFGTLPAMVGIQAAMQTGIDIAKPKPDQFRSEVGRSFRNVAKDYMPDPLTAHGAEQAVAEFGRMATKAIVGGVALGPLGGALAAGAEEGFTASDKLAEQGVDLGTRTAVGAVTGAVTGLGFALPVAGSTVAKTVGLAVAGGPVSFMAQNAATREILQRADYTKLADQYDPFDPVGLALSTIVPLGFGAVAMRAGARRAAAEAQAAASSSRRQENDAQATEQQAPEAAPIAPEVVDAARVDLLRESLEASRVTPPEDFAGAAAHETAVARAIDQLAAGERVEVAQVLQPASKQAPVSDVAVDFKPGTAFLEAKSPAGMVGGTVADGQLRITFAEVSEDMRGKGEGVKLYTALIDKALSDGLRVVSDSTVEADAVRVYEALKRRGYDVRRLEGGTLEDGAAYGVGAKAPAFEVVSSPNLTDPLAQITQRMAARLEPLRTELEALQTQAREQDAAPAMRAADEMAQPEPVATQAPDATSPPPAPDLATIARQAVDTLTSAESPAEALARVPGVIADAVDSMQGQQAEAAPKGGGQTAPPLEPQKAPVPELLGRNSQPFSEGGKPFKTEADAQREKRLHPTKRVMKVKGGYALADKTPKQIKADEAKAKRLRLFNSGTPGKPMSAHEFVVSEGGMDASTRSELGVDGNPRVGNRNLFAGKGKPGLTLEQAAMKLKQAGYITDESESAAADIIRRSMKDPRYTPEGMEAVAAAEREAEFEDYLRAAQEPVDENAPDFDPFGPPPDFTPAELTNAGYDDANAQIKAEVDALIAMAEAKGIDTETLREDAAMATADKPEIEYYEQARNALNDALNQGAASRSGDATGRDGQGQQGEAQRGGGEDRVPPVGDQGGEGLTAPTRADIEAQQARAEQAARDKAAKDKADAAREAKERERAEVLRRSEAAADTFVLGGDPMANLTGQTDIFGDAFAPPPAAQAPAASRANTTPASPLEARLSEAMARNPDALDTPMPTEFDADGKTTDAVSAREYLDTVKAEADQEAADADLFQVAANCFLNMGG